MLRGPQRAAEARPAGGTGHASSGATGNSAGAGTGTGTNSSDSSSDNSSAGAIGTARNDGAVPAAETPASANTPEATGGANAAGNRVASYAATGSERGRQAAAGANPGVRNTGDDLAVGVDYRLAPDWLLGASLAGHEARAEVQSTAVAGSTALQSSAQRQRGASVMVYASWAPAGALAVDAALAYQAGRLNSQRLDEGRSVLGRTRTDGLGLTLNVTGEHREGAWSAQATARAEHVATRVLAFDESGSINALHLDTQRTRSTTLALGVLAQRLWPTSWGLLLPHLRLDWSQAVQAQNNGVAAYVIDASRQDYLRAEMAPAVRQHGWLGLGLSAQWPGGLAAFADLESRTGPGGYRAQRLSVGFKLEL